MQIYCPLCSEVFLGGHTLPDSHHPRLISCLSLRWLQHDAAKEERSYIKYLNIELLINLFQQNFQYPFLTGKWGNLPIFLPFQSHITWSHHFPLSFSHTFKTDSTCSFSFWWNIYNQKQAANKTRNYFTYYCLGKVIAQTHSKSINDKLTAIVRTVLSLNAVATTFWRIASWKRKENQNL